MTAAEPSVVTFGSDRPVTCAVMDYWRRLEGAINAMRPGFATTRFVNPAHPLAFVGAIVAALRQDRIVHLQLPIEGWGNSVTPGSALMAARWATRKGKIVITLHEWTSLNVLRYLSTVPDVLAADGFIFVSPQQREAFLKTPLVGQAKKRAAPIIPIGPNIMPARIDPALVARERLRTRGEGELRADLVVGYFGVLYASKQPGVLLHAIKALHARGVRARLLVCGDFLWDKPNDRQNFLALARELGVADWLDFRGRIDDQDELLGTLSAADVFLLPFSDGVSVRRGSFQAVSQLAIPLVTTAPARADEFGASIALKAKIDNLATVLCPIGAGAEAFADALCLAVSRRTHAIGVDLGQSWRDAAAAHLRFYDSL